MSTLRRRWWIPSTGFVIAILIITGAAFCVGGPNYYFGKYSHAPRKQQPFGDGKLMPSETTTKPSHTPHFTTAEVQTESHTCGFNACSTIYNAYGLNPAEKQLRFRLGTDKRGTNFDPESLGTIHPDIVRVLTQDGFETNVLWQPATDDGEAIQSHLASGHPVLAMIRVKGLHWIVLTGNENGKTHIYDSLKQEVEKVDIATFVKERVLSAILVKPSPR